MAKRRKHGRHHRHHLKLALWILALLAFLVLSILFLHRHVEEGQPTMLTTPSSNSSKSSSGTFNKNQYSIDDSSSLWVVVNKGRILPSSYVPDSLTVSDVPLRFASSNPEMSLRSDATSALKQLFNGALQAGLHLMLASGYRSYSQQVGIYSSYVSSYGQALADTFSAKAGHSEHQTGLAADLEPTSRQCELDACFGNLPEGKWLAANAYKYGFIIRYPSDKTSVTGYQYEPWHMRYVGTALAGEMHKTNITTLEEFFGLQPYTSYPASSYALGSG